MTKLFKVENESKGTIWCFAPDSLTATRTIIEEVFGNKRMRLEQPEDVTNDHLDEDGVRFLSDQDFVGIPKKQIFMLNGSMMHMTEQYVTKQHSGVLWWSEKVPGSKEVWA